MNRKNNCTQSVTPTSIIDQFDIVLNLTFKTNVLAPALIVNPVDVTLMQSAGQTANTQMTITNVGLVSAFDVNLTESFPPEMQVELPFTNIPEIKAQQSVTVPIKVTLIHSSCPDGVVGGNYKYQCAFDKTSQTGQMSNTTFRSGGTCTGGTVGGAVIPPGGVEGSVASPPFRGSRPYIGGINGPVQKSGCQEKDDCFFTQFLPINQICVYECTDANGNRYPTSRPLGEAIDPTTGKCKLHITNP